MKGENMNKRKIKEQLTGIEESLANAEAYVAQNINVEGSSWLHFGDWRERAAILHG